jgi:HopA1 effector protein family
VSPYRAAIAAALQAVAIRSPTQYAWLGRVSRSLPPSVRAELDEPRRRAHLVTILGAELYASFYCHGRPVPARWGAFASVSADPWLARALSEANRGRGSWEPGWTICRLEGGDAVVSTPRLRMRIATADCRAPNGQVRVGAAVSVRVPKELPALSPGFFTITGEAGPNRAPSACVIRVYWNVTRVGAPALVEALTSRFNSAQVPFRLKIADHPLRLDRCDAAVLYLEGDDFRAWREMLRQVAISLTAHLRPRIPAFTLELSPGVGLAEDEGVGESFGARRCELLADAIVHAHEHGRAGLRALDAVAAHFVEAGVQIDAPYLATSLTGRHVL